LAALRQVLEWQRFVFNKASVEQFRQPKNSIVVLHSLIYAKTRQESAEIPSQVIIRAEQECLSLYKSIKSNKHKIKKTIEKRKLSMRLDKRLYSFKEQGSIRITTANKRKTFNYIIYPKLKALLDKYPFCDPLIYENNGELYIAFSFKTEKKQLKQKLALGVDIGIRRPVALSDGRIIIDKKFNGDKRKLRYLKRQLQSKMAKGSKSAKRHLKKLRRKERNKNKNQTHLVTNFVLNTKADTIVLENLKSIKVKKNKYQNKNKISQVPIYELRRILTYKAQNQGKTVLLVSPSYTSQTDCLTGKREGERRGCRFYSKSGLVYDSDINAAINIAKLAKLPISQTERLTYGQVKVNSPIVGGSHPQA
jgi:IS605 OrfB family transposase